MDQNKVDTFVMSKSKFFTESDISVIRELLINADDSMWGQISTLQFKDPTTMLIISFLGGGLGIDRFMIGDTGIGLGKLLTCGGFGIWSIVDLFLIGDATKVKNWEKIQQVLGV